jgi:AraC family transcriptional regulator
MTSTYASSGKTRPRHDCTGASFDLAQDEPKVGLEAGQQCRCTRLNSIVQVSPADAVQRLGTGGYRWFTESIHAPIGSKVEFRFQGPMHLLALYNEGMRRDGETLIDGLGSSRARNLVNKLTFVPAGCAYREWHETGASTRLTFLYLAPKELQRPGDANAPYFPRLCFEDPLVWETAVKLKNAIESSQEQSLYLEALSNVLAHELSRPERDVVRSASVKRGGLASWQKRTVVEYIEEHLREQICLSTLARMVRLSQHHFCRAFKQSFGVPPHQYHVQKRMARAKLLLADRAASVTDIGLALGYSQTSSFSAAFRKTTGWTPSEYRREFK